MFSEQGEAHIWKGCETEMFCNSTEHTRPSACSKPSFECKACEGDYCNGGSSKLV